MALSEIFYPNYTQNTGKMENEFSQILDEEHGPDMSAVQIQGNAGMFASQNSSLMEKFSA